MGIVFNADEIFEMAEQIERNGARFYRKAAEPAGNARAREMLLALATWEERHEKTFASMRKELTDKERGEMTYDPEGEAAQYLRTMADGRVFDLRGDPSKRLTGKENLQEILQRAIGLERDSVLFYLGMKEIIPERLGKGRIDGIIKEEMRHISVLSKELEAVQSRA